MGPTGKDPLHHERVGDEGRGQAREELDLFRHGDLTSPGSATVALKRRRAPDGSHHRRPSNAERRADQSSRRSLTPSVPGEAAPGNTAAFARRSRRACGGQRLRFYRDLPRDRHPSDPDMGRGAYELLLLDGVIAWRAPLRSGALPLESSRPDPVCSPQTGEEPA